MTGGEHRRDERDRRGARERAKRAMAGTPGEGGHDAAEDDDEEGSVEQRAVPDEPIEAGGARTGGAPAPLIPYATASQTRRSGTKTP